MRFVADLQSAGAFAEGANGAGRCRFGNAGGRYGIFEKGSRRVATLAPFDQYPRRESQRQDR
jgi:hypothetical protein